MATATTTAPTEETIIGLLEQAIRDAGGHEGRAAAQIMDDLNANGLRIGLDLKAFTEREGLAGTTVTAIYYDHRDQVAYTANIQWHDATQQYGLRIASGSDIASPEAALAVANTNRATMLAEQVPA